MGGNTLKLIVLNYEKYFIMWRMGSLDYVHVCGVQPINEPILQSSFCGEIKLKSIQNNVINLCSVKTIITKDLSRKFGHTVFL